MNTGQNILMGVAQQLDASIDAMLKHRQQLLKFGLMTKKELNQMRRDQSMLAQLVAESHNDPKRKPEADMLYNKLIRDYTAIVNRGKKEDGV